MNTCSWRGSRRPLLMGDGTCSYIPKSKIASCFNIDRWSHKLFSDCMVEASLWQTLSLLHGRSIPVTDTLSLLHGRSIPVTDPLCCLHGKIPSVSSLCRRQVAPWWRWLALHALTDTWQSALISNRFWFLLLLMNVSHRLVFGLTRLHTPFILGFLVVAFVLAVT